MGEGCAKHIIHYLLFLVAFPHNNSVSTIMTMRTTTIQHTNHS